MPGSAAVPALFCKGKINEEVNKHKLTGKNIKDKRKKRLDDKGHTHKKEGSKINRKREKKNKLRKVNKKESEGSVKARDTGSEVIADVQQLRTMALVSACCCRGFKYHCNPKF